jgi:hypothetical protein
MYSQRTTTTTTTTTGRWAGAITADDRQRGYTKLRIVELSKKKELIN